MLSRLYEWILAMAARPGALWLLALVAFAESSFFPIPPDVMLIPMVLAARRRAWLIAAVCTAASVAGGMAGYGIGYFLYQAVGRPLGEAFGGGDAFALVQSQYNAWGLWLVFAAGLTPLPYKVFTVLSGLTHLELGLFLLGSTVSRGLRFFAVAALLWAFGESIRRFVEHHLKLAASVFVAVLAGGFLVIRFGL